MKPGGQWWLKLVGELPTVYNENPRQGIVHEEGPFDIAKLILETQPFRIDCHYAPRDDSLLLKRHHKMLELPSKPCRHMRIEN